MKPCKDFRILDEKLNGLFSALSIFQVFFLSKVHLEDMKCPQPCTQMNIEAVINKDFDGKDVVVNWASLHFNKKVEDQIDKRY